MQERAFLDKGDVGKPSVLSGKDAEWSAWHFVFQSWIAMLSQKMHAEMKEAAEKVQQVIVVSGARETQARSTQLVHILVRMVFGRALKRLRSLRARDAQRHLVAAYEPKSTTRSVGQPAESAPSHVLL